MGDSYYKQLETALTANGFCFKREAKGSHEIWWNPHTGKRVTVPKGTNKRHTANAILKEAGILHKF